MANADQSSETVKSMCSGYNDDIYSLMENDELRSNFYSEALAKYAKGKVVLDLGTGAIALLARYAAKHGASKVYAIEGNPSSCAKARELIKEKKLENVIEIIEGFSDTVELPEKVDILVHDIIGELASLEGLPFMLRDAQQRFLKPNAIVIPDRVETWVRLAEFPGPEYWAQRSPTIMNPDVQILKLPDFPKNQILSSKAIMVESVGSSSIVPQTQSGSNQIRVTKSGLLQGVLAHMEMWFENERLSSFDHKTHWIPTLLWMRCDREVSENSVIDMHWESDWSNPSPIYSIQLLIEGEQICDSTINV